MRTILSTRRSFKIAPYGATKFADALRMGAEVFHTLKGVLMQAVHFCIPITRPAREARDERP